MAYIIIQLNVGSKKKKNQKYFLPYSQKRGEIKRLYIDTK